MKNLFTFYIKKKKINEFVVGEREERAVESGRVRRGPDQGLENPQGCKGRRGMATRHCR